jgi:hypothetical protein
MISPQRLATTLLGAVAGALMSAGLACAQPPAPPADQTAPAAAPAPPAPAAPAPAAAAPTAPAATPAAAPAASGKIPTPPAGKGQIVFFRPSRFVGMALSYSVHEGDTGVGKLGNGSYFILAEDPGPHTFTMNGEVTDTLHVEVDAGETQYVQQTLGVGIMSARPHITPSDQATFDSMPKLKLSEKKPTDLKPSAAK